MKPSDKAMHFIGEIIGTSDNPVSWQQELATQFDAHTAAAVNEAAAEYKRVLGEVVELLQNSPKAIAASFEEGRDYAYDNTNQRAEKVVECWDKTRVSILAAIEQLTKEKNV